MDLATLIGMVLGVAALVGGFCLEGGEVVGLIGLSAALIVFGGTIGATITSFSLREVLAIPRLIGVAFKDFRDDPLEVIELVVDLAYVARKDGLIGLENRIKSLPDGFAKKAMQVIVDINDHQVARNTLEQYIYSMEQRHAGGIEVFEAAGGYAPTMGIIGTVMGLVHVLSDLKDPETLGPAIAMAFIATLYGVASANLFWLPIAAKLRNKSKKERLVNTLILEGAIYILEGKSPLQIQTSLMAFVKTAAEQAEAKQKGGEVLEAAQGAEAGE